jgi:large subunit ribosomal protein L17
MRHRRKGRILGRSPSHQRALLRSLASALILTEGEYDSDDKNKPKVKGRIVTTIQKAKEVRPLVERCVTIAIRALPQIEAAAELEPDGERHTEAWKTWRNGPGWAEWNQAIAPVVAARRRTLRMLGSKDAVQILFNEIAPRFSDRPGGYTRVLRLAKPRLGDAGIRAILEFVGVHDRKRRKAARPAFESETETALPAADSASEAAETESTAAE